MAIPLAVAQPKPLADLLALLPRTNAVEYRRGQLIYNTAQPSDRIYAVVEGKVIVSRIANGEKQVVVNIYRPTEIFGESALVNRPARGEQAIVLENARVMSWTATEVLDLVARPSHLGMTLLEVLVRREAELTWRMESLAVDTIHLRVARSLVRLSARIGTRQEDGSTRMGPLTHKLLSQYIGSTREIVTHHMVDFRRMGYLTYSRHGIVVYRDALIDWLEKNSRTAVAGSN